MKLNLPVGVCLEVGDGVGSDTATGHRHSKWHSPITTLSINWPLGHSTVTKYMMGCERHPPLTKGLNHQALRRFLYRITCQSRWPFIPNGALDKSASFRLSSTVLRYFIAPVLLLEAILRREFGLFSFSSAVRCRTSGWRRPPSADPMHHLYGEYPLKENPIKFITFALAIFRQGFIGSHLV